MKMYLQMIVGRSNVTVFALLSVVACTGPANFKPSPLTIYIRAINCNNDSLIFAPAEDVSVDPKQKINWEIAADDHFIKSFAIEDKNSNTGSDVFKTLPPKRVQARSAKAIVRSNRPASRKIYEYSIVWIDSSGCKTQHRYDPKIAIYPDTSFSQ